MNHNKVRFGVLTTLIGVTSVAILLSSLSACKSMSRTRSANDSAAPLAAAPEVTSSLTPDVPGSPSIISHQAVMPASLTDPALDGEKFWEPDVAGGPVAGLEAWQDDKPVSSIVTGKQVLFKLTSWTRDTNTNNGCSSNPGIVQASWTIGSKPSADVQRFAGQDCRALDYSGMFTKEGTISVKLDVLSADGEVASVEETFAVKPASNTAIQ
jgi:hypothetical protein